MTLKILNDEVQLWVWPLNSRRYAIEEIEATLSDDEKARAARFVFEKHAARYRAGRTQLREILASYLDVGPSEIAFQYGANGKPDLAPALNSTLRFNLAHSEDLAALAITRDVQIGLDIEYVRPIEDGVARHHFSPKEYADLSSLQSEGWRDGFFRCWTRKEAVIKALGDGLSLPLDSFDVTLLPTEPARLVRNAFDAAAPSEWMLHHFEPAKGCMGAIAANTKGQKLTITPMTDLGQL
ncbi:MAG: 4'-phosphopantetheinyl transferase superfamily protein [Caulobacterales bacterium]